MRRRVLTPFERGVFLDQFVQCRGQPDIVFPVTRHDGNRGVERRLFDQPKRCVARRFGAQNGVGADIVGLGNGDDVATVGVRHLHGLVALQTEQRAGTDLFAVGADQFCPFIETSTEHAGQRNPTDRAAMRNLEHMNARAVRPDAFCGVLCRRDFVAQHLEQPPHAKAVERRTEQHRHHKIGLRLGDQVGKNSVPARRFIQQQLLEQGIVMVSQRFEHVEPFGHLTRGQVGRNVDLLARLSGPVMISAFEREIDKAGNPFALADRNLPGEQRCRAHRLERFQQVVDAPARLIDLVDEHRMRQPDLLDPAQHRLGKNGARGVGVDDQNGEIGTLERGEAIGHECRRTRGIDDHKAVAQIIEADEINFSGAFARAGFGGRVADGGPGLDTALSSDHARRKQKRLGKAGFSCPCRSDKGDCSNAVGSTRHHSPPQKGCALGNFNAPRRGARMLCHFAVSRKRNVSALCGRYGR